MEDTWRYRVVRVTPNSRAGAGEPDGLFRLPHTIRDAGRRLLREMRETNEVRARHTRYVIDLTRPDPAGSRGLSRVEWLARISARLPDVKVAIRRLSDGAGMGGSDPISTALEIVTDLGPFWLYSGNVIEGTQALTRLEAARPDAPRASLARKWIGRLAVEIHDDQATAPSPPPQYGPRSWVPIRRRVRRTSSAPGRCSATS